MKLSCAPKSHQQSLCRDDCSDRGYHIRQQQANPEGPEDLPYPLPLGCDPLAGSTSITWELLAMLSLRPHPQPPQSESAFHQDQQEIPVHANA